MPSPLIEGKAGPRSRGRPSLKMTLMSASLQWMATEFILPLPARRFQPYDALIRALGFNMRRREFLGALGGAAILPVSARAQQGERMRRIGVLFAARADDPEHQSRIATFAQGSSRIGLDRRSQRADRHSLGYEQCRPSRTSRRIGSRSRPMSSWPLPARQPWRHCLQATSTVPIVFVVVIDPVGAGFVASLARPGGNATGFTMFEYGMSGKWLELLKEIAPRVARAAILRDPAVASGIGQFATRSDHGIVTAARGKSGRRP